MYQSPKKVNQCIAVHSPLRIAVWGDNNQEKDKLSSMQWSDLGLMLVWVMVDQIDKIDLEL